MYCLIFNQFDYCANICLVKSHKQDVHANTGRALYLLPNIINQHLGVDFQTLETWFFHVHPFILFSNKFQRNSHLLWHF